MSIKKKIPLIALGIVVLLTAAVATSVSGLSEGLGVTVYGIDLSAVADGEYTGTYTHGRWTNTLTVRVKGHKITSIGIEKDVAAAGITNCSGEIFRRVIGAQTTAVDAVSGATVTSKAYLKAIENALTA